MKKPLNKKLISGIIIAAVVLIAGGVFAFTQLTKKPADTTANEKKKISEPLNVIPQEERPYLQIAPVADGRNIEIIVKELKKPADRMEYELEYQSGSLLQGIFGELSLDTIPARVTELMGSCSAGGACTYHEDIKGGTLLTRYDGPEDYALKSDWKYIENDGETTDVSSKDAKFQLSSEDLASQKYMIIFNTAGYPEGLEGAVVSEVYSFAASSALDGSGELTIRSTEEGNLHIMGWNGQEWVDFEGEADSEDPKMVTAEVELMELYLVVSQ